MSNNYPKKNLNILVSTPTFLPLVGGAELGIHEIYKRIGKNHNVTILTPEQPKELLNRYSNGKDYLTNNYKVIRFEDKIASVNLLPIRKLLSIMSLPYIKSLKNLYQKEKFDVANFHYIFPHGISAIYVKKYLKIPMVISLVGRSDVWQDYPALQKLYAKKVLQNANTIIPITQYCIEGYEDQTNVNVIPYGVEVKDFSPKKRNANLRKKLGVTTNGFLVFTVQRLAPVKRIDVLVKIMAEVVKTHPEAVLAIGGQGERYDNLKRLIKDSKLTKNVRLLGYISEKELPAYFASADAFAFHSMSETFGIVFAQAMSAGLPIISIKSTCIPEVVRDNENGLLVEPFDVKGFSGSVNKLIEDKNLYKKISKTNRERALKEFDWDVIAARYEKELIKAAEGSKNE